MDDIGKIIEEILFKPSISSHSISDMLHQLNRVNLSVLFHCTSKLDETMTLLCNHYKSLISKTINDLIKYISLRHLGFNNITLEEDFIGKTLAILSKIVTVLEKVIETAFIDNEGNVMCRVLKPFHLRYTIATPGYITRLPLDNAIILSSLGYTEILTIE
ncbi:hypothetical protein Igag_0143 [Ignisphaera aggregans DSM 17230]|uniref:Uncharacterized protein n=1 Tax=Ignisphaera aggregans (strain DSM 17230 / JCM 13409 / AQ1.S1) TaxID=583356 RepID=E0SPX2_IGNAA|nr:hypothetical protein Igag_0143 [Ignisphaera aggregans DSM 17230]